MAKLIVRLHGKEQLTIDLIDGQEYVCGRSQDCQIPLEKQKGISRHHFKLHQKGSQWMAERISRYGQLIYRSGTVDGVELENGVSFQIPPYEFSFVDTPDAKQLDGTDAAPNVGNTLMNPPARTASTSAMPSSHGPGPGMPNMMVNQTGNPQSALSMGEQPEGNLETTSPGVTNLIPYLRIKYPGREKDEVLELEGNLWVSGRDQNCEIPIDDGHISRRHFELTQTNDGLYITDLGSANGTEINGKPLTPHEPHRLQSGDKISIMDLAIILEMRDREFKNKLMVVNQTPLPQVPMSFSGHEGGLSTIFNPNLYFDPEGPGAIKMDRPPPGGVSGFIQGLKKNKVRMALVILVPIIILGALLNSGPSDKGQTVNSSTESGIIFDNLTPEQKSAVKDIFNLARSHYTQGRYELCLAELNKLHEIIPFYEDSKALQSHCVQGSEMTRENQDLERKERARQEAQQKINFIVQDCQRRLGNSSSMDDAKECLGSAIELDPNNAGIVAILESTQAREELEKQRQVDSAARQARIRAGDAQYQKAKGLYKKGRLRDSIVEYERFLKGSYPDPKNLESTANRELSSVKKDLDIKVQSKLSECKAQFEKKNYKPAIESCDLALREDPDNKNANVMKSQVLSDLRREMKSIYEDSVLEESLGEIEGAKEKWRKILQNDIESDDYYQKAKRKLQKYGIGI